MTQAKVAIFCGKGGVGKTTLSLALGLRLAGQGRRVLVVSSHPLPELAIAVSLDGLATHYPVAARNLFVVHIDPRELLKEVVERNFPVEWVARAVLNSSIYQNLIEVAPGLKEFYFLARLQALAERSAKGVPSYEALLWDAPATGHFLSTLASARNFETFLTGPLAAAGGELHRFFSNMADVAVFPTTTLEEMAIEETMELCDKLAEVYQLRPRGVVANLISPLALASEAEWASLPAQGEGALGFALDRGALERERIAALRRRLDRPLIGVERIRHYRNDLDALHQIGEALGGLPGWL